MEKSGWMLRDKRGRQIGNKKTYSYIRGNASSVNYVTFNKAKIFTKAEYAYKLSAKLEAKGYTYIEVIAVELKIMTENDIVEEELLGAINE